MGYFTKETAAAMRAFLEEGLPRRLDLLRDMVGINSFTLNPAGVNRLAELTAGAFAELGFAAERVPSADPGYGAHLLLSRPGAGRAAIGLVSHLDTVFSAEEEARNGFRWRVEGDRAYGPGTADIKGGTVVALMTLEALRRTAPAAFDEVTWTVLMDASEEMESDDFGALCRKRLAGAAACLVFEAGLTKGGDDYVVASRKGRAEFRIAVEGRGAHSGVAHRKGASAVRQLADIVARLEALTDYGKDLTVNVGRIAGGSQINRVPHEAEAFAEMRAFDPDVFGGALADILALDGHSSIVSADGGFACATRVELARRVPAWPRNGASDGLLARWQAAGVLTGRRVVPERRGGLSDGNFTWDLVPTIDGLGPSGGNPHCSEHDPARGKEQEYALLSSFAPRAALNAMAILGLLEDEG